MMPAFTCVRDVHSFFPRWSMKVPYTFKIIRLLDVKQSPIVNRSNKICWCSILQSFCLRGYSLLQWRTDGPRKWRGRRLHNRKRSGVLFHQWSVTVTDDHALIPNLKWAVKGFSWRSLNSIGITVNGVRQRPWKFMWGGGFSQAALSSKNLHVSKHELYHRYLDARGTFWGESTQRVRLQELLACGRHIYA